MSGRHRVALAGLIAAAAAPLAAQQPVVAEQVSGAPRALLQAVSAVTPQTAWVSGHSGAVLRTIDGGDHWQLLPIAGAEKLEFRAIQAVSANEAWVMSAGNGDASRIYHTRDGGAHWTQQFSNADSAAFYDCLTFFDAKHGVAFSDAAHSQTTMLRTEDGGAHWALLPPTSVPAAVAGEGAFSASGGCIVHVDAKRGWVATGSPAARIFGTADAGKTWQLLAGSTPVVHAANAGWTGISFVDAKHGIGVAANIAGNYNRDTSSAAVAITTDGGKSWSLRHRPELPGALFGVIAVPRAGRDVALAAAMGGLMLTTDNGDHWTPIAKASYWSVGAAGKRAWAVGPGGRITRIDF
ncbi:MAG TPA: YCF48-related protein [Gemmatimonadales bacterium]|jgi:photosystem II stability/assembly factor-like uncharacterized protein